MRSRRSNFNSEDEAVHVEWNGLALIGSGYRATTNGEWTTITATVVGTGGSDHILFRESSTPGASNGLGPLLDNITLRAVDGIEEPSIPGTIPNGDGFARETLVSGLDSLFDGALYQHKLLPKSSFLVTTA